MSLYWNPQVALSAHEERIIARCKTRKIFAFLRLHRHQIFDRDLQDKLVAIYPERNSGKKVVPPARLAMLVLLQAACGTPDHEAIELTVDSQRWQMVLDCLGDDTPPCAQGTLYNFRQRLIAHDLDKLILEKTIQLARETKGFSHTALRAAFDASPLRCAGRVEDTFNLIGHAAWQVVRTAAQRLGRPPQYIAAEAGIPVVNATSIKAGLDIDWDQPDARKQGLAALLDQIRSLANWLESEMTEELEQEPLRQQWQTVRTIIGQDTEPDPDGSGPRIRQGVARNRRISISDPDMRHGRKSKAQRIDGYKRHLAIDLDLDGLICGVAITPANKAEREGIRQMLDSIEAQGLDLQELFVDRGYLGAPELEQRRKESLAIHCKPFPLHNGGRFTKDVLDFTTRTVTCPDGVEVTLEMPGTARFSAKTCNACTLKSACTRSKSGRHLAIHPEEDFHQHLREVRKTPQGRKLLRQRVAVEHRLAAIGQTQGNRARYKGERKNLFDLRRHAAVHNLMVTDRLLRNAA
jgi:IS5 family transposase